MWCFCLRGYTPAQASLLGLSSNLFRGSLFNLWTVGVCAKSLVCLWIIASVWSKCFTLLISGIEIGTMTTGTLLKVYIFFHFDPDGVVCYQFNSPCETGWRHNRQSDEDHQTKGDLTLRSLELHYMILLDIGVLATISSRGEVRRWAWLQKLNFNLPLRQILQLLPPIASAIKLQSSTC